MKIKRINLVFVFLFSVLLKAAGASDSLWLQADKYEPAKQEPTTLSLYFGDFPSGNIKLDRGKIWVVLPDGSIEQQKPIKEGRHLYTTFETKYGGLYTAHALYETQQDDGIERHYAKLQFHRFGREVKERKNVPISTVPLEIKPITRLNMHRRLHEGGKFTVQVLYKEKPLNTEVSVTTQEGWRKKLYTNDLGIAEIRFIKDRVSRAKNRRMPEKYILRVQHTEKHPSTVTYTATYILDIYPTPREWQSKSLGYLTALAAIMATAVIVAIKRRKGL